MMQLIQRVGFGYDVHPFAEGRELYLGGVKIEYSMGLLGHSDADALIHAITDSLLGALGSSDIGVHFPNTDQTWKNARSTIFLEKVAELTEKAEGRIINIDATVVAEAPKINPHVPEMKRVMAASLRIRPEQIGLKATTNEKMGFVGREEGIAAFAVATIAFPFTETI